MLTIQNRISESKDVVSKTARQEASDKIASDVEAFLAKGNKITVAEIGQANFKDDLTKGNEKRRCPVTGRMLKGAIK